MEDHKKKPIGAGKSSFELIDTEKFFRVLDLQKGIVFLDLACGRGAYSLEAATIVGASGRVIAVDLWPEGIALLEAAAEEKKISNIKTHVSDAGRPLPLADHCIDVCLMATVLHDFVEDHIHDNVLAEMARVLKPAGMLAVMEFKKIDGPPGPPRHIRLSPQQVDALLLPYGFGRVDFADVGPFNYLARYGKK